MRISTITKSCLSALFLILGMGYANAQADYTLDTNLEQNKGKNSSYAGNCDVTVDGITWNVTGNATMNPWRIGGKSLTEVDREVYTKTAYPSAVKSIDLTVGGASSITVNSLKLLVSSNAEFTDATEYAAEFQANSTITFAPAEGEFPEYSFYKFVFNVTVSDKSNKYVQFSKVEIYNGESVGPEKELVGLAVSGTPADLWQGDQFTHEGITVTATWDDQSTEDVTERCQYSGYDMDATGEQTVTVTYKELSATYDVNVLTIANTKETAYTASEAIALIKAGKGLKTPVYVKGIVSKIVTEYSSSYGNITFNVSADGTEEGDQFQFYRNIKAENTPWTDEDIKPGVGDEVIGCGVMKKYKETYEFDFNNYLVDHKINKVVATISVDEPRESINIGESDTYQVVYDGDAELSVASSNTDIAEVSLDAETNMVTVKGIAMGTASITISAPASDKYTEASYTYVLTIVDPDKSLAVWIAALQEDYANAADVAENYEVNGVTLTFSLGEGKNAPKYYTTGEGARLYNGNTMTVSVEEGYAIESIAITFSGETYTGAYEASVGTYTDGVVAEWNGFSYSVTFTATATSRMQKIEVVYVKDEAGTGIAETVAIGASGEDIIYNLNGQRLGKVQKGLNIVNGKKVIFK